MVEKILSVIQNWDERLVFTYWRKIWRSACCVMALEILALIGWECHWLRVRVSGWRSWSLTGAWSDILLDEGGFIISCVWVGPQTSGLGHHLLSSFVTPGKQYYGKYSKFSNTFLSLFLTKMLVFRAGIHKMFIRITNREDPDLKKQSHLGLSCLSMPFLQASSVRTFRTFIAKYYKTEMNTIIPNMPNGLSYPSQFFSAGYFVSKQFKN